MSSSFPAKTQSVTGLVQQSDTLQQLFAEARYLSRLQAVLDCHLEAAARPHCKVASLRHGCLVLIFSNANWATRIRYRQQRLLSQLTQYKEYQTLSRITFKILPQSETARPVRTPPQLSQAAASHLRETAETLSDPKLRAALERLAQRASASKPSSPLR